MRYSRLRRCRRWCRSPQSASTTLAMRRCSRRASSALADTSLVDLAAQLVAIDSVNPELIPDAAGERELADFVAEWCEHAGLAVELVGPRERPSVIAVARGSGGGRSLLLNAHLETDGVAAHGSRPHLGIDAIAKMGPILVALKQLDERLQGGTAHPLVGPPSLHASLIEGGQEFSSYPARCLLSAERRTIPGETVKQVERELRELAGEADLRLGVSRDPFEIASDDAFVQLVGRVADEPEPVGVSFWADSGLIAAAGIPTVLYGPVGDGAHAEVEWVDLASLERVRDVVLKAAVEWSG